MTYKFEKVKVLLADSEPAMQRILCGVLSSFGIGEIIVCNNGEEALSALKLHDPDLLMVEWTMDPVSGVELTTRIRRGEDVPDPYIPIIFMTAFSSKQRVVTARDAGITEFLSKPFASRTLYRRIHQIIEHPRPFIEAPNFCGPDRRRTSPDYQGPDRRGPPEPEEFVPVEKKDPELIEIKTARSPQNIEYKIIEPPPRLQKKTGSGGLPESVLKKAEITFEEIRRDTDLKPIALKHIEHVKKTRENLRLEKITHDSAVQNITNTFVLLKANGGMFEYPIITEVASNLLDFLEESGTLNSDGLDITTAHLETLDIILKKEIKGDIDPAGWALVNELKKACARYFAKYPPPEPESRKNLP